MEKYMGRKHDYIIVHVGLGKLSKNKHVLSAITDNIQYIGYPNVSLMRNKSNF